MDASELSSNLQNFFGSETIYKQPDLLGGMHYTEGVKYFCENAGNGAYWFLDLVSTEAPPEDCFITLEVIDNTTYGKEAQITGTDGNDNETWQRFIPITDAPEGSWKFWKLNGTLILPSEY